MAVRNAFYSGRSPSLFYAAHQNEVKLSDRSLFPIPHALALEMSRVNRGLNKARNPDYSVRIRHSVSEMGDRLQPLGDPAQGQRKEEKGTRRKPTGRNKKKEMRI